MRTKQVSGAKRPYTHFALYRPVLNVSWIDITKQYLPWLKRKTGMRYRLQSEAEWEYAARAGTTTSYPWGDKFDHSKANGNDGDKAVVVGRFPANGFGLHDLHGNLWEWVEDCYKESYSGAPIDGGAVTTGNCTVRVLRGGSWNDYPKNLRSASRWRYYANHRLISHNILGFARREDAYVPLINSVAASVWCGNLLLSGCFVNAVNIQAAFCEGEPLCKAVEGDRTLTVRRRAGSAPDVMQIRRHGDTATCVPQRLQESNSWRGPKYTWAPIWQGCQNGRSTAVMPWVGTM